VVSAPWVRFEDEHLLVVSKPAGVTTHRADAHAQDGMYEWVQDRRPGETLSVLHRLDKATSGLLVFGKSRLANQSIAAQFESRALTKRYELLVGRDEQRGDVRRCDRPVAGGPHSRQDAVTDFERVAVGEEAECWAAAPHTGRTHQVRKHAAMLDMPIVGDETYGGRRGARVFLHAAGLRLDHPTGGRATFADPRPASFDRVLAGAAPDAAATAAAAAREARAVLLDPVETNAYLWIDRDHDGFPDLRVERLDGVAFARDYTGRPLAHDWVEALLDTDGVHAVYAQHRPRGETGDPARLVAGAAPARFSVLESGCRYLLDLEASATSTGLFLDQRETRRRLLESDLTGRTVCNAFAHTGSLTVAAAKAGAETLTLDLSPRYLDWARENLRANDLDPDDHDAIYGDALEWMDRLARKGRTFDLVLVDPPSTSTTGKRGRSRWVADRDLHDLVTRAARLARPDGTLYVSTNLRRMPWSRFLDHLDRGLAAAGRVGTTTTGTLPLDHRSGPGDPPYLKSAWIRLDDAARP
jgi:23S rRNA (cytosine1962-C5)-methyltransferase